MIVDERLVTYINSLDTGNTAMLDQIEREATAALHFIIHRRNLRINLTIIFPMMI